MLLDPFMPMARQKHLWTPRRLGRVAWSVVRNLRGQIELLRIFSLPAFRSLVPLDPLLLFRHLSREYLFRGLSSSQRTASILNHYRFLISRMSKPALRQFGRWEVVAMEHRQDGRSFAVTLGLPRKEDIWEGESILQLKVDDAPVYVLQFTIVPGRLLHSEQRNVVFIQRVQGVKGCFEQVSAATRAFGDIAPPLLLATVLRGIAAAWEIRELAGISAKSQACNRFLDVESSSSLLRAAYDDFFVQLGATRVSTDFYSLPLPLEGRPIKQGGNGHNARTRKRRALRDEIANRVCQAFREVGVIDALPGFSRPDTLSPEIAAEEPSRETGFSVANECESDLRRMPDKAG